MNREQIESRCAIGPSVDLVHRLDIEAEHLSDCRASDLSEFNARQYWSDYMKQMTRDLSMRLGNVAHPIKRRDVVT